MQSNIELNAGTCVREKQLKKFIGSTYNISQHFNILTTSI